MLYIIPCGNKKATGAAPARSMYQGAYFKKVLAYALSQTEPSNIRILSGKYGLLKLDDIIQTYNQPMGKAGGISISEIREQAAQQSLLNEQVKVIAGRAYVKVVQAIWPNAESVMDNKGRMGYQMQWLTQNTPKGN